MLDASSNHLDIDLAHREAPGTAWGTGRDHLGQTDWVSKGVCKLATPSRSAALSSLTWEVALSQAARRSSLAAPPTTARAAPAYARRSLK